MTTTMHGVEVPKALSRFVLDVHLGRLARYLRLLGFDASWKKDATDEELVAIATREERILLTRDRELLKRRSVAQGYFVRETVRRRQILEVLRWFDLFDAIEPFRRCLECNGPLDPVAKVEVEDRLPPRTRRDYEEFQQCRDCHRIYWKGSHYDALRSVVDDICREGRDGSACRTQRAPEGAALAACGWGWSVVPVHTALAGHCSCGDPSCPAPGKHPRIAWDRLMHEAAARDEVARWWRRWPQANVGVVTGTVSDLVVLDVDPRHGGGETFAELEGVHGALPHTVEALTGGGGQHLYFRHPGVFVPSRPVAPGLDVKGDGGLIVSPPSVHVTGRRYAWEAGCAPDDAALADLPSWLLAMVLDPAGSANHARRSASEISPRTEDERREFAELWAGVGVELWPGDRNYLCPFHADHHPSLHVDAEGCRFYCFGCGRGGGTGRLRRLIGTRGEAPRRATFGTGVPAMSDSGLPAIERITLPGRTYVDVAGESGYQDALLELSGGRRHYGGVRMETVARLAPEPDNAVDPGAIVVTIAGRIVGHLSRVDAGHYRDAIVNAIERAGEASCAALIVGGWEREHGDVGYFGVRLLL
jgi:uncharacterized protein with PIN domain